MRDWDYDARFYSAFDLLSVVCGVEIVLKHSVGFLFEVLYSSKELFIWLLLGVYTGFSSTLWLLKM